MPIVGEEPKLRVIGSVVESPRIPVFAKVMVSELAFPVIEIPVPGVIVRMSVVVSGVIVVPFARNCVNAKDGGGMLPDAPPPISPANIETVLVDPGPQIGNPTLSIL
jgi:hypothetical protein